MKFEEAIALLDAGRRITRTSWNGMFVSLVPESSTYRAHIDAKGGGPENVVPWSATPEDKDADDWACAPESAG